MTPALPVLDLSAFRQGGAAQEDFLSALRRAAREVGFFYLTGHGIAQADFDRVFATARDFFALTEAEKLSVQMVKSPQFYGYNVSGAELTRNARDWREQFDIGPEQAAIPVGLDTLPWARLIGPNLWPEALPALREVGLDWHRRLNALAVELLEAFALALEQPRDALAPIHARGGHARVKLIRYPSVDQGDSDQGVGAHKDSGFLTLLAQDDVGGLEVELNGHWVPATPIPGTFVVNIGEILELCTGGYLRATVHRVISPPKGVERLSVAHFFGADLDVVAPVLALPPHLASEATGTAGDPQNPLFRDIGKNYLKGRLRSHPDVAQVHHADLLEQGYART
ncbi:MAG: 2-oxobutyrate oxidase [Alphaproteobacteria bacterium HGW-Alphaproteobacteria-2]|nr:MAG: 2-oxobutyrate oxidase [Alphaproteobacteria bacterium HGW-Alphaproteobacteria-2]